MGRSPCCDKAAVKRGPWSAEEDALLRSYMERHADEGGDSWIALPRKAGLRRCGKSCRLRWLNYLRPELRHGGFTPEEDQVICALYAAVGSRWSVIAAHLPGRTDNGVKNHWNTRLKKKLHLFFPGMAPPLQTRGRRRGGNHYHHHPNAAIDAAPAQQPLQPWPSWSWSSQTIGGVGHMDFGAAGGETDKIAGTNWKEEAAAARSMSQQQPADASYSSYEPALSELDEIFRSISGSGGEQSDLSYQSRSSSTDVDAAMNWNLYQQGESVLQNHLGLPHLYW